MTVFTDDFNRANGALGGNWVTTTGTLAITNGTCTATGQSDGYNSTINTDGRMEASCRWLFGGANTHLSGPVVKNTGATRTGFWAGFTSTANPPTIAIKDQGFYNGNTLASVALGSAIDPLVEVRIVWDAGHLEIYVNGTLELELDSSLYSTGLYPGLCTFGTSAPILDFRAVGGAEVGLSVSPNVIGNYGDTTALTFTGTNTAWSSGTPGTPTFTVDHGTLSSQSVSDADTATATYDPGSYLGPIVFTDPSTGATAGAVVTSDPGTVPPASQCPFDEGFVAMANRSDIGTLPAILSQNTIVAAGLPGSLDLSLVTAVADLWYAQFRHSVAPPSGWSNPDVGSVLWDILNGGVEHTSEDDVFGLTQAIDTGVEGVQAELDELRGVPNWTLQEILDNIRGTDARNLSDVYDLVEALDSQAVLDAIAALRGDTTSTVANIFTSLGQLRTVNTWTLDNVKTWIEAVETEPTDLSPVLTAISNLSTKVDNVETNILNEIAALGIVMAALQVTVGGIDTAVGGIVTSVGNILDIVEGLQSALPVPAAAPVWPGLAGVDLGTPVALVDGVQVTTPMHGVIVEITGQPAHAGRYVFGEVNSWKYAGAVMFQSDNGNWERAESFGVDTQIITPRTMGAAVSAILRVGSGYSGTITPWVRAT